MRDEKPVKRIEQGGGVREIEALTSSEINLKSQSVPFEKRDPVGFLRVVLDGVADDIVSRPAE